jgi:hypothetical protein
MKQPKAWCGLCFLSSWLLVSVSIQERMSDMALLANPYEWYKDKYERTKPIRGRADDVRPIGKRARDWELVVKEDRADGTWYGAYLYRTKVVMFGPNGDLELNVDAWPTPKTADFMNQHSPFRARKTHNNIWVNVHGVGEVPILTNKITKFKFFDGAWRPAEPVVLKQKVVDRKASNEVRAKVKGFIDYATTMLKLSDGWVRADTIAEYRRLEVGQGDYKWQEYKYNFLFDPITTSILQGHRASRWTRTQQDKHKEHVARCRAVIEMLSVEDTNTWDRAMYCILEKTNNINRELVSSINYEISPGTQRTLTLYDYQYRTNAIKDFMGKLIRELDDVHKVREVEGGCARTNVVI